MIKLNAKQVVEVEVVYRRYIMKEIIKETPFEKIKVVIR